MATEENDSTGKGTAQAKLKINGTDIEKEAVASIVVEMDIDQPDMCTATVKNTNEHKYTDTLNLGDAVEVEISESGSGQPKSIFKGEVVGLEPSYESGGETHCVVRAFNKLHRLSRGKKSKTFEKMSDGDIVQKISQAYGLTAKVEGDVNIRYDHIYQHHQTDLEFLLIRARRCNYEVVVDDTTLFFRKRDVSKSETLTLELGAKDDSDGAPLKKLSLRLSSANQVTEVTVRFWDPNTAKEIKSTVSSLATTLGDKAGSKAASGSFSGASHKVTYDVPVASTEEAKAVATSMLEDLSLNYITGEGVCKGNPALKAGIIVKIKGTDKRTDGKYYVSGCTHVFSHKDNNSGGFLSKLRFRRNAESTPS